MKQDSGSPLWEFSATEPEIAPGTIGEGETDVAIVGGGFTGLSTALHCAEQGIGCHLFEARQIGHGGSGRNAGLVNAGLWLPPQDVRARLGEERGARLVNLLGGGPEFVFSLIEKHQIRCEVTRTGTIHAAHSTRGFEELKRRAGEWQMLGAPVELLSRDSAASLIGSDLFHGGLLDRRAGTINPMGYARGLARAALAAGARISTGIAVTKLERKEGRWHLRTGKANFTARCVFLCTNAYSSELWPGLSETFMIINYFQVATQPLGDRIAQVLRQRQGLWDTGRIMFSLRRDSFDRLILGSMGMVTGGDNGLTYRWAARTLRRLFPGLGPVRFENAWHGRIAMTPDHIPRIFRLAEGLYAPIAYNGRGIAPGTVFGRAMAGLLSGGNENDLPLPVTGLARIPNRRLKAGLYQAAFTVNQFIKGL
jgi:L-pipecolate oxidase